MSACHNHCGENLGVDTSSRYRRALWWALLINAGMFLMELIAGYRSGSVSLLADAIDFAGDAASYGISLAVLAQGLIWRARTAYLKGMSMLLFGVFVMGKAIWAACYGQAPEAVTMGVVAVAALLANITVVFLLYAFRDGDANMRSVWLCSRNDAIGNFAVLLAAVGVFGTSSRWPDLAVAGVMALLAISAGVSVIRQALGELSDRRCG